MPTPMRVRTGRYRWYVEIDIPTVGKIPGPAAPEVQQKFHPAPSLSAFGEFAPSSVEIEEEEDEVPAAVNTSGFTVSDI